ncbi:zinc finger protein OZF isoform X2 [Ixodes scapularis]
MSACVICGSTNYFDGKDIARLFRFPSPLLHPEKRAAWVAAVRSVHPDGSLWVPKGDCHVCSAHFVTGAPGDAGKRPEGEGAALVEDTSCQLRATEDIWFKCCLCAYVTTDQHGIISHLVSHGDEQFKCQHCSVLFDSMSELQCHSQIHRSDMPFKCPRSPKLSLREKVCFTHTSTCKCPRCHLAFKEHGNLTKDYQTHLAEKSFKCKQCPKAFAHSGSLTNHNRIHAGEKAYKCKQCPKAFTRNSCLTIHNRMHTGEKPYRCELCSRAFTRQSTLAGHIRTHTGNKPYKCKHCPKAFAQRYNLTVHSRIHTSEKPYECKLCPRAFAQNIALILHNRTHTGERPYECKLCPKAFTWQSTLTSHIRTHTGNKPYKCKLCPKAFTWLSSFKCHNRMHTHKKQKRKQ